MVDQGFNVGTNGDDGESEGLDAQKIREIAGFLFRAPRRRPFLAASTFVVVAALGITVSLTMPRTYHAEIKLLAQRSNAIRALSSANAQGMDAVDNPTKDVPAMIMRRDNLVALVKDANLVERFERTRSPALRLKDRVMALIFGPLTDEEKVLAQVYTLEKKMWVNAAQDTLEIGVEWSNAQIVYDLATIVQRNFLEARYDSDVAVINDSISVLEEHGKSELAMVDSNLAEYQKLIAERSGTAAPASSASASSASGAASATPAPVVARRPAAPAPSASQAVATDDERNAAKELEDKRAKIRSLEDTQQRTLEALRRQLVEARMTLTPMHPTVVALQQQVDALSEPSPDLVRLKGEERALMDQIAAPNGAGSAAATPLPPRAYAPGLTAQPSVTPAAALNLQLQLIDRDGPLQLAQSKLAAAARAYEDTMARIDAAKVELDITQKSFTHRYTVLQPAELPKKPKKPIAQIIGVGSVFAAALLALLVAAAADLFAGRILESWQVRRRLNLEILGEFDKPAS